MYSENGEIESTKQYLNGKLNGLIKWKNREYEYLNDYKNGKGKIYNEEGELFFEGQYEQDMKIKGREYINGKLVYEGEYIYDGGIYNDVKYNGKGYDENGCLIYEIIKGNGKGKVREYYYDGTLLFEGEFIEGRKKISK